MSKKQNDNKRVLFCFSCYDKNVGELFICNHLIKGHPDLNEWFLYEESTQRGLKYVFGLRFNKRKRVQQITDQFTKFKLEDQDYPPKTKIDELKRDNLLEMHSIQERMRPDKIIKDLKDENGRLLEQNKQLSDSFQRIEKRSQEKIHELKTQFGALKTDNGVQRQKVDMAIDDLQDAISQLIDEVQRKERELKDKNDENYELKAKIHELKKDIQMEIEHLIKERVLRRDETMKDQRDHIPVLLEHNGPIDDLQMNSKAEVQNLYRLLGICKLALEIRKDSELDVSDWELCLNCALSGGAELAQFIKNQDLKHNDLLALYHKYEEAENVCKKAIEIWPQYMNLYGKWANLLIEQQKFKEAEEIYEIYERKTGLKAGNS